MDLNRRVVVYGAYGHTGRFVVAELLSRGYTPILSGRDAGKLTALKGSYPDLQTRVASIDDPTALDRALQAAMCVINCAGPFLDTAAPVIEAALRARIPYVDTCAEQRAVLDAFQCFGQAAIAARVTVMPAMAFFGALADLLATAALGDWAEAERIEIAVALDSWHPTAGTRLTGARNHYQRVVVSEGKLAPLADPPPTRLWRFAEPFGTQQMVALPLSEVILLSRHVRVAEVKSYMNFAPLFDLRDPQTPAPIASDAQGRSTQRFAIEARVSRRGRVQNAIAMGQDIYATTAPLAVEALQRILHGSAGPAGVLTPGAAFDARDFLHALPHLQLIFSNG